MCGALTEAPLGTLALSSPGNYLRPLEMVIQRQASGLTVPFINIISENSTVFTLRKPL